ncbi:hypothetical protein [Tropicibacter oceani]|uniref:Peptidoglycan binding-like domain-containing protein n=1 Tax=Tropicibacter oceani TaxID=3058420 RepID=A0ABY8QJ66_9RHOB|nr:hypothetical protein [Tropicibacter oceani]WGW04483.1 hypothetical protein QF118_02740 [Tropicibacter oceani]
MTRALSSFAGICLSLLSFSAGAEGLNPCPGLDLSWQCEGGQPVARATRNARDDAGLPYRVLSGGQLLSLPVTRQSLNLTGAGPVTVVGLPKGEGPCCLSQRSLPPAPPDLCIAPPPGDPGRETPASDPRPAPERQFDFAAAIEAVTACPSGAAGHLCRGSLMVSRLSGAPEQRVIPITLTATGARDLTLTLSGAASCNAAGQGALFCQLIEGVSGRFDLPMTVQAGPSFDDRKVQLCADLAAPGDPRQQLFLVQTALTGLGLDPGPIDGAEGPRTLAAAAQFAGQFGLKDLRSARDPRLLAILGLGGFDDAQAGNNRACTDVLLPRAKRPSCQPATTVASSDGCACRYARMIRTGATSCACVEGYRLVPGRGCVERLGGSSGGGPVKPDDPPPAQCDAASTVKRNGACVCRYGDMVQVNASACQCRSGQPPIPGRGCP